MDYKTGKEIEDCIYKLNKTIGYRYDEIPNEKIDIARLIIEARDVRDRLEEIIEDNNK